jgi:hypothetical protein
MACGQLPSGNAKLAFAYTICLLELFNVAVQPGVRVAQGRFLRA